MKHWKRVAVLLAVLLTAAGIGTRIYQVNAAVEDIPCQVYELGETAELGNRVIFGDPMDGYFITIKGVQLLSTQEFMEKYGCIETDLPGWEYMSQIFDIELEIANENNEETGIDLNQLYLQNESALASFDAIYYRIANAEKGYENTSIAVRPGTSVTLQAEFPIPELNFSARAYQNLWDLDLKLVVTLYPEKKMMRLQK